MNLDHASDPMGRWAADQEDKVGFWKPLQGRRLMPSERGVALAKEITRQIFVDGCSLGHANEIILEALDAERAEVWEEAAKCMPHSWLDSLLSGDGVPPLPWGCREMESFLRGLTEWLRARAANEREEGKK